MSNERAFKVGDFVFVQHKPGPMWVQFFGYVAAIDGDIYTVAPWPRWNDGEPYCTEDVSRGNMIRALFSFAGPVRIGK